MTTAQTRNTKETGTMNTTTTEETLTVANTILAQLHGRRFIVMTGSKQFLGDDNSLTFQFPTHKGSNYCKITLTSDDLYDIKFKRIHKVKGITQVDQTSDHYGIYSDQLQEIFTNVTGLDTHL